MFASESLDTGNIPKTWVVFTPLASEKAMQNAIYTNNIPNNIVLN